jgi:ribosomal protein L11 methyltransferase
MQGEKTKRTLVVIQTEKGADELLPADVYEGCNGTWVQELDAQRILINLYPRSVDALLALLAKSSIRHEVISISEEEDQDYVALIKKHFTPISVGDITILPPWKKTRRAGPKIIIEPGMAFGTGRHESTRVMLHMMNGVKLQGVSVLDIGCGSGILAIWAHMMGAHRVVAADHDLCAAQAVGKNAELNSAGRINVVCADLHDVKGQFDVVLANLDARTFSDCSAHIIGLVKDGGRLLVSGIEAGQKNEVLPLFSGLRRIAQRRMRDWYGFTFEVDKQPSVQHYSK